MTDDDWLALVFEAASEHEWEEVLLAAAPVLTATRAFLLLPVRRAAASQFKGLTEQANEACRADHGLAEALCDRSLAICCGAGPALAAMAISEKLLLANVEETPRSLLLANHLSSLQPLLARVTSVATAAGDETFGPSSVALLEIGVTGPQAPLVKQLSTFRTAGLCHAWPLTVEVWAMAVEGESSAPSEQAALRRITSPGDIVAVDGATPICMQPLRDAVERGATSACAVCLDEWSHTMLSAPVALLRWRPSEVGASCASASPFSASVTSAVVVAAGVADAVIVWVELEVSPGRWVSRAPKAVDPPTRQSDAIRSKPMQSDAISRSPESIGRNHKQSEAIRCILRSGLREPQAAFPVRRAAVARGSHIEVAPLLLSLPWPLLLNLPWPPLHTLPCDFQDRAGLFLLGVSEYCI